MNQFDEYSNMHSSTIRPVLDSHQRQCQDCSKIYPSCVVPSNPLLVIMHKKQQAKSAMKKTVSFSKNAKMKGTLHLDDYTTEEIQATWYARTEMKQIREDVRLTVKLMDEGLLSSKDNEDSEYCTRGLECRTSRLSPIKTHNKRIARDVVLDEQDYQQFQLMTCDPERLATVYNRVTYQCQVKASMVGLSDEKIAKEASSTLPQSLPQSLATADTIEQKVTQHFPLLQPGRIHQLRRQQPAFFRRTI